MQNIQLTDQETYALTYGLARLQGQLRSEIGLTKPEYKGRKDCLKIQKSLTDDLLTEIRKTDGLALSFDFTEMQIDICMAAIGLGILSTDLHDRMAANAGYSKELNPIADFRSAMKKFL